MSLPQGAQLYRLPTGEDFFWSGSDGRWVFPALGIRVTPQQLEELRARRIGPQQLLTQQVGVPSTEQPRSVPGTATAAPSTSAPSGWSLNSNYVPVAATNNAGAALASPIHYTRTLQPAAPPRQSSNTLPTAQLASVTFTSRPQQTAASQTRAPSYAANYSQPQSGLPIGVSLPRPNTEPVAQNHAYYTANPQDSQSYPSTQQQHVRMGSTTGSTSHGDNVPNTQQRQVMVAPPIANPINTNPSTVGNNAATSGNLIDQATDSMRVMALAQESKLAQVRAGRDPDTHVAFNNVYGPPETTTHSELLREGIKAQVRVRGSPGDTEPFDEDYRVRKSPKKFFVRGKVFRILWSEPAGDGNETVTTYDGRFGQGIHSKVRRFVVIREGDNYCAAIPIVSYGGQGLAKPGVKKSDCAIIYIGKAAPVPRSNERALPGEAPMRPNAIRVDPDERGATLSHMSRVNFGKVSTIEHNVKVKAFGMVSRDSMRDLHYQFMDVWRETFEPIRQQVIAGPSNMQPGSIATACQVQEQRPERRFRTSASQPLNSRESQSVRSRRSVPSTSARSMGSARMRAGHVGSSHAASQEDGDDDDRSSR